MTVQFAVAAEDFVQLVRRVPPERLDGPGLGEWTLRELIGHTSRAITTVTAYLEHPEPEELTIHSASEYLEVVLRQHGDDEAILLRGRAAGAALGDELAAEIEAMRVEAATAIAAAGLDRCIAIGGDATIAMRLGEYLRTRVFELTVHGIDIADAAGIAWAPAAAHVLDALHLAAANASARGTGIEALRLLTGRRPDAGLEGVLRSGA
ncbi:maleylpyruvate isomerase N-terminal domain-containing protein [Agrococcus sp. TSP3-2-1]|uniref:maleylpyruvate isomerase N-terminal domain-containing protein n=1 Tax=Agrococcus sp. TSP3-2-1 TaxID=2804583 RepID=UPI003CE75F97